MPNWCYNFATIICPSREIYNNLLNSIIENRWFQTFAPLGEENTISENSWNYNKAIETWNTKWDATDVEILNQFDDDLILEVTFETAWSPPTKVYSIMNKTFGIEITAFYEESGCEFFGKCIYSKEEELDDAFDFPSDKDDLVELRKIIGSELDDFMSSTWEELEERWNEEEEEEEEEDDDHDADDDADHDADHDDDDDDDNDDDNVDDDDDDDDNDDDDNENNSLPELLDINSDIDSDDDKKEETHACIKKEVVVKKDYNYGDDIITKFKVKNE